MQSRIQINANRLILYQNIHVKYFFQNVGFE